MNRSSELSVKKSASPSCWIFCEVIDNFGDAGVAWRLAQAIQAELGWTVHFWIDHLPTFSTLEPTATTLPYTSSHGITVHHWESGKKADHLAHLSAPDIVIETFACQLSDDVLEIIRQNHPIWLNWEYLSAEASHESLHGHPSPQADGTQKYFWFMGFSERSGGLLREQNFAERQQYNHTWRTTLNLPPKTAPEWLLFGYHSPIWAKWLTMWQEYGQPLTLLLAGTTIIDSLRSDGLIPSDALIHDGDIFTLNNIQFIKLPFVAQQDFDRLLALADGLIIRGEDSFVRAQLSGKPFLWHIYPQTDNIHLDKLNAFWQRLYPDWPSEIANAHELLSQELNNGRTLTHTERLNAWQTLSTHHQAWQSAATMWRNTLFSQESALEKLAKFTQGKLK